MAAPAHSKGDRLDRVAAGQQVHLAPFTLTDPLPVDGWLSVIGVASDGATVTLTFGDESTFTGPVAQLVLIGWS